MGARLTDGSDKWRSMLPGKSVQFPQVGFKQKQPYRHRLDSPMKRQISSVHARLFLLFREGYIAGPYPSSARPSLSVAEEAANPRLRCRVGSELNGAHLETMR